MADRDITGGAQRTAYGEARKIARERDISDEELRVLAEGVREFDRGQSLEHIQAHALRRIADHLTGKHSGGNGAMDLWELEQRDLRRREVVAQEMLAVQAVVGNADLETMNGWHYQQIMARLRRTDPDPRMGPGASA